MAIVTFLDQAFIHYLSGSYTEAQTFAPCSVCSFLAFPMADIKEFLGSKDFTDAMDALFTRNIAAQEAKLEKRISAHEEQIATEIRTISERIGKLEKERDDGSSNSSGSTRATMRPRINDSCDPHILSVYYTHLTLPTSDLV